MKILSAKDFGHSKVINVVENPDDPKWVHISSAGERTASPSTHTGDTAETGKTLCHDCRYNWRVQEYSWTGDGLTKSSAAGRIAKTDAELRAELRVLVASPVSPTTISGMAGQEV